MRDVRRRAGNGPGTGFLRALVFATWAAAVGLVPASAQERGTMVIDTTSARYRDQAVQGARQHDFSPIRPPRNGRFIYGHWTPYFPPDPATLPAQAEKHVIARGDTLWDIAGSYFGDNLLWPYIWEANGWVTYPHWIYPGDVLVLPALTVVPQGALEEVAVFDDVLKGFYPAGGYDHVHCGHFLASPNRKFSGEIIEAAADPAPMMVTLGDVVYINIGAKDGVLPGDEFAVVYPYEHFDISVGATAKQRKQLEHPITGEKMGYVMRMAGRLKVILLGEEVSTARIVYACDAIEAGYDLYPYTEVPIPLVRRHEREHYFNELSQRGRGFVVYGQDDGISNAQGTLVSIDLGSNHGVMPGDTFRVYRDVPGTLTRIDEDNLGDFADFKSGKRRMHRRQDPTEFGVFGRERRVYKTPPRILGEVVVLYTEANTATAVITENDQEVGPGDRIVYVPIDTGLGRVATFRSSADVLPNVPLTRQAARPLPPQDPSAR